LKFSRLRKPRAVYRIPLDLRVQALGRGVVDPVAEVGEDVRRCVLSIRAFSIIGGSRKCAARQYQRRKKVRAART